MSTQLYSELIRSVVKNPAEKKKSKLVEMVAKEKDKYWEVIQLKIESGLITKKGMYIPTEDIKDESYDGHLKLKKGIIDGQQNPSEEGNIFLSRLNNSKILSSDGTEMGRTYDFEIYVSENPWKVWKLLVKPTGISPLKKRLRIAVKSIDKVTSEGIYLKEGWIEE